MSSDLEPLPYSRDHPQRSFHASQAAAAAAQLPLPKVPLPQFTTLFPRASYVSFRFQTHCFATLLPPPRTIHSFSLSLSWMSFLPKAVSPLKATNSTIKGIVLALRARALKKPGSSPSPTRDSIAPTLCATPFLTSQVQGFPFPWRHFPRQTDWL